MTALLPLYHHRRVQHSVFAALYLVSLIFLYRLWQPDLYIEGLFPASEPYLAGVEQPSPAKRTCRQFPGAEDVFVILKTGATEAHQKLPVHFKTTLRCIPHWLVISDLEEEIQGHLVHDSFDEMDDYTKDTADEFFFYDLIHRWHALGTMETSVDDEARSKAWRLDKWKPLPVVKKALDLRPHTKWFFFMDADTSLIWSNLLQYLSHLDPEQPLYIGSQWWNGKDTRFAHGGSGYIISNKALRMAVHEYENNIERYNELTRQETCGDVLLAKVMKNAGVELTGAQPIMQREPPFSFIFTETTSCYPVVTYHHMPPDWIEVVWEYEQLWLAEHGAFSSLSDALPEPIRHRHVFTDLIQPYINASQRAGWDNLSSNVGYAGNTTLEKCRTVCENLRPCIQWRFTTPGECKIANQVRLGERAPFKDDDDDDAPRRTSGWVLDRVEALAEGLDECEDGWILP